jgi:glycosyltransferase involved in cell wall biosynthesis
MNKFKILIEGWRGISHSIALVNQNQILALRDLERANLYHKDVPFYFDHWNNNESINPGFNKQDYEYIKNLTECPPEAANSTYRIATPLKPPNPRSKLTITYIVTEFGLRTGNFIDPSNKPSDFTKENNLITTPTTWTKNRLIEWGFEENKLILIPHGVNRSIFSTQDPVEVNQQRTKLGYSNEDFVLLNIGIPTWNKGTDLLIKAYLILKRKYKNLKLILKDSENVYGLSVTSQLKDSIKAFQNLVNEESLKGIHIINGNLTQSQLSTLYNISDLYVSPYRAEGFNLPVLEALSCGKQVVVTDGGATDDFTPKNMRKIRSKFQRSDLPDRPNSCYLEPLFDDFLLILDNWIEKGRPEAISNPNIEHTWAKSAVSIMNAFENSCL